MNHYSLVEHILVGLDDVFYSFIDRAQMTVGDDDLGLTLAWDIV